MSLLVWASPLVETHHHRRALPLVSLLVRALPLVETINHDKQVGPPVGPQYYPPVAGPAAVVDLTGEDEPPPGVADDEHPERPKHHKPQGWRVK